MELVGSGTTAQAPFNGRGGGLIQELIDIHPRESRERYGRVTVIQMEMVVKL